VAIPPPDLAMDSAVDTPALDQVMDSTLDLILDSTMDIQTLEIAMDLTLVAMDPTLDILVLDQITDLTLEVLDLVDILPLDHTVGMVL